MDELGPLLLRISAANDAFSSFFPTCRLSKAGMERRAQGAVPLKLSPPDRGTIWNDLSFSPALFGLLEVLRVNKVEADLQL